jgi:hypothetical protein
MRNIKSKFGALLFVSLLLTSCVNNPNNNQSKSTEIKKENLSILKADFLGNYHGIQPSYFMKNQYGDDMIISGQKIQVPSIDFKFLIKEDNVVSLQQINLDDNSRVYYDGTYKILSNEGNTTKIECSLSDGQTSNPTYVLLINNIDKKGTCTGNNEPEFKVEKNKN